MDITHQLDTDITTRDVFDFLDEYSHQIIMLVNQQFTGYLTKPLFFFTKAEFVKLKSHLSHRGSQYLNRGIL